MMSAAVDVDSLISVLESPNLQAGREVKELVLEILSNNKDAWLVNTLIDSYAATRSQKCLEIIVELHEPHDKHVFDRLNDHLRGQHKLASISILAGLVYKQVSWLHKIVIHPLISTLLKYLKTEDSDIPVVLSGLLVVTALLPVVPVTFKDHLPPLFEAFSHLATLCLKAPPQVPELYRYHLEVGLYCLHHRLYGMYPYHFLTYLRNIYSKQEQQQVFEHVIKPMVDKVRLHPLLFTTSREKEVSRERWRHKEVHDILVECAQFSLDLTEGSTTEMSVSGPQRITDHFRTVPKVLHAVSDFMTPGVGSLVGSVEPVSVMTSSLHMSEVVTSHANQPAEPQTPTTQGRQVAAGGQQSAAPDTSVAGEKTPQSKKRLSQSGLTLTGKLPASTETTPVCAEQHIPIPPSPLRPDFTTESPLNAQQMQAIRKLTFSQSEAAVQGSRVLEKALVGLEKLPHQILASRTGNDPQHGSTPVPPSECTAAETAVITTAMESMQSKGPVYMTTSTETRMDDVTQTKGSPEKKVTTSVANLPKVLDSLDKQHEDTDSEVSELMTDPSAASDVGNIHQEAVDSPSHLPSAASMAALMKKVNRIRFNSININPELLERSPRLTRPRSCPTMFGEQENKGDATRTKEEDSQVSFSIESPPLSLSVDEKKSEKSVRSSSSQTSLYALSTALLRKQSPQPVAMDTTATETEDHDGDSPLNNFPYQELFSMILPFSPFIQCYYCTQRQSKAGGDNKQPRTQPALDDVKPLFASYSPVELLDHILDQGSGSHHRLSSALGSNVHKHVPGDLATCDDVAILRGQIEMLRHQLLYERHKRELHAQRNRRLLSRTVKTTALEEQNNAMQDQLLLQEKELVDLREALKKQQQQTHQLQHTTAAHEAEIEKLQKTYRVNLESLETKVKRLESQLESTKNDRDKSVKELQSYQASVYSLNKEVEILKSKAETTRELEEQVKQLNKELLLMGELQQKYQSRLVAHSRTESDNIHTKFLLETYKTELNSMKTKLSRKTVLLESSEAKVAFLEDVIKKKDQALFEHRQLVETARDTYRQQLEALQDKYDSLKKAHCSLQTEFLNVYEQIGRLEATAQRANRQREPRAGIPVPSHDAKMEGDVASSDCDEKSQGASAVPPGWRAPASESSIDSAEEAYSVDTSG